MASDKPELSVIVVNYNTRELLAACLGSIAASHVSADTEIILVDNNSRDGSVDMVRSQFPNVRVFALEQNMGFAIANNIGAAEARGDFILLLNTDTEVFAGSLDRLLAFAKEYPDAGLWGGRTLYEDGSLNATSCFRQHTVWNLLCRATGISLAFPGNAVLNSSLYGAWQRDDVRPVDVLAGCYLLVARSAWEALGGFDTRFFMYGEDMDLCLRAKRLGYQPMFTPESEIIHKGEGSQPLRAQKLVRSFTGMCCVVNLHFKRSQQALARGIILFWPLPRILGYGVSRLVSASRGGGKFDVWYSVWKARHIWTTGTFHEALQPGDHHRDLA